MTRFGGIPLFVTIFLLLFTAPSHAAKKSSATSDTISLTPSLGSLFLLGDEPSTFAPMAGLKLSYDIMGFNHFDSIGFELTGNYFMPTGGGSGSGYMFRFDGIYPLDPKAKIVPFIALGGGALSIDSGSYHDSSPLLNYGVGFKYFIENYLALRGDLRHIIVFDTFDTRNNVELTFGLTYLFGKERKKTIKDSDKDGVPDDRDKCPNTPLGVKVDKDGCSFDSDSDGVPDAIDKCPDTPIGVNVDKNGCPLDEDQDGVPDYLDKCEKTPVGVPVDKNGCPTEPIPEALRKCVNVPVGVPVDKNGCPIDTDQDGVPDYLDKCADTPAGTPVDKDGCPTEGVSDYQRFCRDVPVGVPVDSEGCPFDADRDGIPDYLDKCPDTPANVKVDRQGCPLDSDQDGVPDYLDKCPGTPPDVAVDLDGCPFDEDRDGVPDYLDTCPNTPPGIPVDANGCPLDSDHDGIPDYFDKCPDTPAGTPVDIYGCPTTPGTPQEPVTLPTAAPPQPKKEIIFEEPVTKTKYKVVRQLTVEFDFDRSEVRTIYFDQLKEMAEMLKLSPDYLIQIEGHTDNVGSSQYNYKLSKKRAESVKKKLVKFGANPERVITRGFAFFQPIESNDTTEGRQRNRRVETVVTITIYN